MKNPNISWIETQKIQKNAGADKKTATQLGGCNMKICFVLKVVIPLLRVRGLVRVRQ